MYVDDCSSRIALQQTNAHLAVTKGSQACARTQAGAVLAHVEHLAGLPSDVDVANEGHAIVIAVLVGLLLLRGVLLAAVVL